VGGPFFIEKVAIVLDNKSHSCYNTCIETDKEIVMSQLVDTRVIEICDGEWVAQFAGGVGGWTTFSDVFATEAEAQAFLADQIDSADFDQE
jgi:hypothetical protein